MTLNFEIQFVKPYRFQKPIRFMAKSNTQSKFKICIIEIYITLIITLLIVVSNLTQAQTPFKDVTKEAGIKHQFVV